MKKKTPYLDFYHKCINRGVLPDFGLCGSLGSVMEVFLPNHNFRFDGENAWYWGYDGEYHHFDEGDDIIRYEFTPLRQNIVLFLAAMNNEL